MNLGSAKGRLLDGFRNSMRGHVVKDVDSVYNPKLSNMNAW
jgi:hypothetical protein